MKKKCYIVTGPTANGKSKFALNLAKEIHGCIINADSQQILSELPTLTDNPTANDMNVVPHYLYGYKTCFDRISSFTWCVDAVFQIKKSFENGFVPILVGGTGFYLKSLIEGHSPVPATTIDVNMSNEEMFTFLQTNDPECKIPITDTYRLNRAVSVILETGKNISFWQKQEKEKLIDDVEFTKILVLSENYKDKIKARIDDMFPIVEKEVINNIAHDHLNKVIGFTEIKSYLNNEIDLTRTKELMYYRTCQYAKRQKTWFKHQMSFDELVRVDWANKSNIADT